MPSLRLAMGRLAAFFGQREFETSRAPGGVIRAFRVGVLQSLSLVHPRSITADRTQFVAGDVL
jgi:hypothetical protein